MRRRDPRLTEKLAMISGAESLTQECRSSGRKVSSKEKSDFEERCGFAWEVVKGWGDQKEEYTKRLQELRLGKWGVRPFGCSLPQ